MSGSLVGYAFVLGMIALFNPCGFPLLPVYLTAFVGDRRSGWIPRALSGLRAGRAVTAGFLTVFAVMGLLAGAAHTIVLTLAPWLMVAVGAAIAGIGVRAALGKALVIRAAPSFRTGRSVLAMAGFGVAYAIGSLSCSLPVFIAAVGGAFASGSAPVVVATVVAYALGMGLLVTVLSVAVSLVDATALRAVRPAAAVLPRVAGILCVLIGLYLVGYWVAQLGGPDLVAPLTAAVDGLQGSLAAMIEAAWLPVGMLLVVIVLGVLVAAARRTARGTPAPIHRPGGRETS